VLKWLLADWLQVNGFSIPDVECLIDSLPDGLPFDSSANPTL
jgi:hypothetical protein